jgi:hypothetical protein
MKPTLQPGVFVFATIPTGQPIPAGLNPVMTIREAEGLTLILDEQEADTAGLNLTFRCRMVTLAIHSSLEAVGFLAAITPRLAQAGTSVNPVSAFHHDHLFVPVDRAEEAVALLRALAVEHRS